MFIFPAQLKTDDQITVPQTARHEREYQEMASQFPVSSRESLNTSLSISCVSIYRSIYDEKHISVTLWRECFQIKKSVRLSVVFP